MATMQPTPGTKWGFPPAPSVGAPRDSRPASQQGTHQRARSKSDPVGAPISHCTLAWSISPAALSASAASSAVLNRLPVPAKNSPIFAARLVIDRIASRIRVELHVEFRGEDDPRTIVMADEPAGDWRWSSPLPGSVLLHADVPGLLRLTVLVDRDRPQPELLLATTPLLSDVLGLQGGVYGVPELSAR